MIHLGIIGIGTIFEKHCSALELLSKQYSLTAVYDICDISLEKLKQTSPFTKCYSNLQDFLRDESIDAILIATPPQSHFSLAKQCLKANKHVLLEKPAVLSLKELRELYQISEEHSVLLHISYHAAFAVDLLWFLQNQTDIERKYHLGKCGKIACHFYDPYVIDGKLIEHRKVLEGSLIDSGVNALSVCSKLTDLSNAVLEHRSITHLDNTVISSYSHYQVEALEIEMYTAWDKNLNQKKTLLTYPGDAFILLEHTQQKVVLFHHDETIVLFPEVSSDRLTLQYKGVFEDFYSAYHSLNGNKESSLSIHKLLLEQ